MHQEWSLSIVGACVLITPSVCFISSGWSLMNGLALGVPPSLVGLSPNRHRLRGADQYQPLLNHPLLSPPPPHVESAATDWQVYLSGC